MHIDTLSYTNKDFKSIWPELLDLVSDLTDRWDPNNSNESDVGVALLKLKAFIADKLNYNIDKNILENFPSSVTQRGNAQKIYDSLGYELQWYKSATTKVIFKFINSSESPIDSDNVNVEFSIPKFTQLTNSDNSLVYTTLNSVKLDNQSNTQTSIDIDAIEGSIETLSINGIDLITINNLDADYRLYFTESMIASNGIFVNNVGMDEFWNPTFNLESTQLGQKVFKFGIVPNSNQCYIEFPQDSAELFGEGINIRYVISSGSKGNMKRQTLSTFAQEYPEGGVGSDGNNYSLSTYIRVTNPNGTNNGQDPESLESAYKNYQKTVNTFNTLVTLMDYMNAIYRENEVSNCVITDRTTDFNHSCRIKSRDLMGQKEIISTTDMNAFNLGIYVLNKADNVYDKNSYDNSFKTDLYSEKLAIDSIKDYKSIQHDWMSAFNSGLLPYIFKSLISIKGNIQTYSKISSSEIKDIISNIKVSLYNAYQSRNINFGEDLDYDMVEQVILKSDVRIKNVALSDFDYDIGVMNAYNQWHSLNNPTNIDNDMATTLAGLCSLIAAKSILAGVTPLFIFDNDFTYSYQMAPIGSYEKNDIFYGFNYDKDKELITFNQSSGTISAQGKSISTPYQDISAITTQAHIKINSEGSYTLKENENVFFYRPSYISTSQISTYFYIALKLNSSETIGKDSLYKLRSGEYLCRYESKDSYGNNQEGKTIYGIPCSNNDKRQSSKDLYVYGEGTIIKPNFEMNSSNCINVNEAIFKDEGKKYLPIFVNLESDKTIDIMDSNITKINKASNSNPQDKTTKTIYCTWIVDDVNNTLFNSRDQAVAKNLLESASLNAASDNTIFIEHILQNNEVFIYTDSSKSDLIICQSGTKVKMPYVKETDYNFSWSIPKPSLTDLNNYGITDNVQLKEIPRSTAFFEIEELQIETLGAGVKIKNKSSNNNLDLNNSPIDIPNDSISWEIEGKEYSLPGSNLGENNNTSGWKGFSRLSVFSSKETVFTLKHNIDQGQNGQCIQSIALFTNNENWDYKIYDYALGPGQSFSTNYSLVTSGGIKQSVEVLKENDSLSTLKFIVYKYQPLEANNSQNLWEVSSLNPSNYDISVDFLSNGTYQTSIISSDDNPLSLTLKLNLSSLMDGAFSDKDSGTIIPLIFSCENDNTSVEVDGASLLGKQDNNAILFQKLLCYQYVGGNSFTIKIFGLEKGKEFSITMYQAQKIHSKNKFLNPFSPSGEYLNVENSIESLDLENNFDYSNVIPENESILNPLDPLSFYKPNHICNNITISQIDNINISMSRQSVYNV